MSDRKRLLGISGLNLAERLAQMNDSQLEVYVQKLNSFIETFPEDKKMLTTALAAKEYAIYVECLSGILSTLSMIHADEIAEDGRQRLHLLSMMPHEEIDAYTTQFLEAVTMLAIDIQMAEFTEKKGKDATAPEKKSRAGTDGILVVDDAQFTLSTMKYFLRETGHKVTCVPSGAAALTFLKNYRPALFILDIEMPEMDGYELARKIKEAGHQDPIIFLTGSSSQDNVIRAAEAGAIDFIVKPVSKKLVIERIRKHIAFRKPQI